MLLKQSTAVNIGIMCVADASGNPSNVPAIAARIAKNGGTLGTVGVTVTNTGADGHYYIALSTVDTNTVGHLVMLISPAATGYTLTYPQNCQVVPWDPTDATRLGLTNLSTATSTLATSIAACLTSAAFTTWNGGASYLAPANTTISTIDTTTQAVKLKTDNLPSGFKKNTSRVVTFDLLSSSDHVTPTTGVTVTAQVSLDGGAFSLCANSVVEIGFGSYAITLTAAELNANVVVCRFTGTGADPRKFHIFTTP